MKSVAPYSPSGPSSNVKAIGQHFDVEQNTDLLRSLSEKSSKGTLYVLNGFD